MKWRAHDETSQSLLFQTMLNDKDKILPNYAQKQIFMTVMCADIDKRLENTPYGRLLRLPLTWFVVVIGVVLFIGFCVMDPYHSTRIPLDDALAIKGISAMQHGNPDPVEIALSYHEFKTNNAKLIPHFIFRTSSVEKAKLCLEVLHVLQDSREINPEYVQVYFDDDDVLKFVQREFPKAIRAYKALVPGAYKADLFRLLVLYKYGGIYNDIGHRYLVPAHEVITNEDEFVAGVEVNSQGSFAHAIYNGILAAYPHHPVIKAMIEQVVEDISYCRYGSDPLDITGPGALGRAMNVFFGANKGSGAEVGGEREAIRRGVYTKNGHKLKFLEHSSGRERLSLMGKDVIRTKFPGYYDKMYSPGERYKDLWAKKKVYISDARCIREPGSPLPG